jgi:hypothetical protein
MRSCPNPKPDPLNPLADSPNATPHLSLKLGDRVAYASRFLKNTGQHTGDIPFARGRITRLTPLGDTQLAHITWDREGIPEKVLVVNLSRVTEDGVVMDVD